MIRKKAFSYGMLLILALSLQSSLPQEAAAESSYASPERREAAVGHYSRARALLVEALREFEAGRKIARPDMLLDSEEWRISVVSRTEELNRVLDPKPRVSKSGVYFNANPLLLRREKERLPAPIDEARSSNAFDEEDFKKTREDATRARLNEAAPAQNEMQKPTVATIKTTKTDKPAVEPLLDLADEPLIPELDQGVSSEDLTQPTASQNVDQLRDDAQSAVEQRIKVQNDAVEENILDTKDLGAAKETAKQADDVSGQVNTKVDSEQDIAAAIEEAIQARMKGMAAPKE